MEDLCQRKKVETSTQKYNSDALYFQHPAELERFLSALSAVIQK